MGDKMKTVVTFGVFDYFHLGHLMLFKKIKAQTGCDKLVVAVQKSEYIKKYKPNQVLFYSDEQRIELVSALSIVDQVITYTDVDVTIKSLDFDVFARGEDQNHSGFIRATEYAQSIGKEVIIMQRTKNISSTDIKEKVSKLS